MAKPMLKLITILMLIALPAVAMAVEGGNLRGKVTDPTDNQVTGAKVTLFTGRGSQVVTTVTDAEGIFAFSDVPVGNYLLEVDAIGWSIARQQVAVTKGGELDLTVQVSINPVVDDVTVTASATEALSALEVPRELIAASEQEMRGRTAVSLPQALREEPSVHVQQTSTSQGSVFLRGLTGQRVVALIDGIRYNNTTFRPGPTQYLATVPLQSAGTVEIVTGPASVQYGSDGLGGTINVITATPFFSNQGTEFHGQFAAQFGSADLSGGSALRFGVGNTKISAILGGFFLRVNDLRPGDGIDSHSVVTRFFGISSEILGNRLQDTAFTQYGGEARVFFKPTNDQQFTFSYIRNDLRGNRRYDQLNGGNGNLQQGFEPQTLDFFYTRYQKQRLGIFDSLTGTFSFNRQRDDRQSQGQSFTSTITAEFNRTDAFGYNVVLSTHTGSRNIVLIGSDLYDENVKSDSYALNPATNRATVVRGRFPNDALYKTYGFYFEDVLDLVPNKLRLTGGLRYGVTTFKTRAKDDPIINGRPVGLDASTRQDDVTFNFGASFKPMRWFSVYSSVNRGFRTPNVNDLGGVGITSNGFTVTAEQVASIGGEVGNSAGATARTTGRKLTALNPETVLNVEGGVKVRNDRFEANFSGFRALLDDVTLVRAVVVPRNVVGQQIAGQTIVSQGSGGALFINGISQPVIARVNGGKVRFIGVQGSGRVNVTNDISVNSHFFYIRSEDESFRTLPLNPPGVITGLRFADAPDFEGGLPPSSGFLSVKYQPRGKRYWFEVYSNMAGEQDRLSSVDLNDQRQGAIRSRASIAAFFAGGARSRGLIGAGRDGRLGTADDVLTATGETLAQIQDRVLGRGINSAPLFTKTPGYALFNMRGGLRVGERSDFVFILENILDKNYRIHGSGTDGSGVNFAVRYQFRF